MIKVHCSGCGLSEEINSPKPKIGTVSLADSIDPREWIRDNIYTTHLCRECLGKILHNYFDVSAEGQLDIPAFIEPPQSLKVVEGRE